MCLWACNSVSLGLQQCGMGLQQCGMGLQWCEDQCVSQALVCTWTPNVSQARAPASVYLCVELALAESLALLGGLGGQLGDVVRLGLGIGVKVGVGVGVRVRVRGWG